MFDSKEDKDAFIEVLTVMLVEHVDQGASAFYATDIANRVEAHADRGFAMHSDGCLLVEEVSLLKLLQELHHARAKITEMQKFSTELANKMRAMQEKANAAGLGNL